MRRSQAEKLDTHERILEAAARQIRLGGPESISIAGLMKAANLTHGGFYKHFASRDALIAAAVRRAARSGNDLFGVAPPAHAGEAVNGSIAVKTIVDRYLSRQHRDNATTGCAIAALAADISRLADADAGQPVREKAERGFARMSDAFGAGPESQNDAIVAWCAMLGALTLSRVFRGDARSDEILQLAKQHIVALAQQPPPAPAPALAANADMSIGAGTGMEPDVAVQKAATKLR